MEILLVLLGLAALLIGGEILVRGAVDLARALNISPMVIGLTVVGFGTSTPELMTSVTAALAGSPGVAIGNVVGSNIANILLILGVAAVLAPIAVGHQTFRRDSAALFLVTLAAVLVLWLGQVSRPAGAGLVAGLALYLVWILKTSPNDAPSDLESRADTRTIGIALAIFAAGLVLTLIGARALVAGAIQLAQSAGVSEAVIGLTLVAVGTSLPELVTSVIAARRGMSDVALGNIIGSNIFNVLGILGATALIAPIPVPPAMTIRDGGALVAATILMILVARSGWRVSRIEGGIFLVLYAGYIGILMG